MKKRIVFAILFNFVILCFEVFALIECIKLKGILTFTYYTTTSNFLALIVSLLFCIVAPICLIKNKTLPTWLSLFRFTSTVCLCITFIISLFIIVPLYPNLLNYMILQNPGIFQHLICPLLSLFSFLAFEKHSHLPQKALTIALIPTLSYGAINLVLNILKITAGPYPFFYLFVVPWYVPVLCITAIILISIFTIKFIFNSFNKSKRQSN